MPGDTEKKLDGSKKGFAGLSSMTSDVEFSNLRVNDVSKSEGANQPTMAENLPDKGVSTAESSDVDKKKKSEYREVSVVASPSGNAGGKKFAIGLAIVIGLIWLASEPEKKNTVPDTTAGPSEDFSTSQPQVDSIPSADTTSTKIALPNEEIPPVGEGNVLSVPQIRYCTAQSIRIDAAREILDRYDDSQITRFNQLIDDYNDRCSNFRYRRGALETARTEVEHFRAEYMAQGQLFLLSNLDR